MLLATTEPAGLDCMASINRLRNPFEVLDPIVRPVAIPVVDVGASDRWLAKEGDRDQSVDLVNAPSYESPVSEHHGQITIGPFPKAQDLISDEAEHSPVAGYEISARVSSCGLPRLLDVGKRDDGRSLLQRLGQLDVSPALASNNFADSAEGDVECRGELGESFAGGKADADLGRHFGRQLVVRFIGKPAELPRSGQVLALRCPFQIAEAIIPFVVVDMADGFAAVFIRQKGGSDEPMDQELDDLTADAKGDHAIPAWVGQISKYAPLKQAHALSTIWNHSIKATDASEVADFIGPFEPDHGQPLFCGEVGVNLDRHLKIPPSVTRRPGVSAPRAPTILGGLHLQSNFPEGP